MSDPATSSRWRTRISREAVLLVVILLTVGICSLLFPYSFRSLANFQAVLRGLAVDGILAVGMTVLLVAGVFDLSVGSAMSLAGVVAAWLMKVPGWPPLLAAFAAITLSAAGGTLNGLVIAKVRVNALITTLATMGIFQGIAVLVGGPGIEYLPMSFTRAGQAEFLGVQSPVWLMGGLALTGHYLLAHTRFFRRFYYIGSNIKAARLSGIEVERMQIFGFAFMGAIAGLAGIAFAARVGSAVSNAGGGAELRVITAVILGGASLTGGKGTIGGALLGVVFMALLGNVLLVAHVSSYWQGIVLGLVLILAVAIDSLFNPKRD
jgi:ribose/xylose/arabinose/galactoside ABC-type transport system permease subunit